MINYPESEMRIIAFFGLRGSAECVPQAFDIMIEMTRQLACKPTLLSTTGRLVGFQNAERKLRQSNFKEVRHFEFYALPSGIDNRLKGVDISGSVAFRTDPIVVVEVREDLLESMTLLLDASREIAKLVRPLYGVGFRQQFQRGPTLFACGMRCPGTAKEDLDTLQAHFGNLMYQYYSTKGLLSDLFDLNFLTAAQLDRPLGSVTLSEWILSDARERGELSQFTDELWLWKLTPEQIVAQRPVLKAAGRIVDFWHEERLRREAALQRGDSPPTSEEVLQAFTGTANPSDIDIVAFAGEQPSRELSDDEKRAILKRR